jgi:hypothetical protein
VAPTAGWRRANSSPGFASRRPRGGAGASGRAGRPHSGVNQSVIW